MRGLRALLYGIDTRTQDNFLHDHQKLRIQGVLQGADGRTLSFMRRKGAKNTLLETQPADMTEDDLASMLGGVSEAMFINLFGINHSKLIEGGEEILKQDGEVGQALFSATLGNPSLYTTLAALDEEADALFKPRGSTQSINAELKDLVLLNKEIKAKSVSAKSWVEQQHQVDENRRVLEQTNNALSDSRQRLARLQRIQRTLPKLAQRQKVLDDIGAMGDVVALADDFSRRRQQAIAKLQAATVQIERAEPKLQKLVKAHNAISVDDQLIAQQELINQLYMRLDRYSQAIQDAPTIAAQRQQIKSEVQARLNEVRPNFDVNKIEELRPLLLRRATISKLGQDFPLLKKTLDDSDRQTSLKTKQVAEVKEQLLNLGDVLDTSPLQQITARGRKVGDIDGNIRTLQAQLTELDRECKIGLERTRHWQGNIDQVEGVALPSVTDITHFEDQFAELHRADKSLAETRDQIVGDLDRVSERINSIAGVGHVPSEEELLAARELRNSRLSELREQWLAPAQASLLGQSEDERRHSLDALEVQVRAADELSDRLRHEADRVGKLASAHAEKTRLEAAKDTADKRIQQLAMENTELLEAWHKLWQFCQIEPDSPRQMHAWTTEFKTLRNLVVEKNRLAVQLQEAEKNRQALREELKLHLVRTLPDAKLPEQMHASDNLEAILSLAEDAIAQNSERQRARQNQQQLLKERLSELEELQQAALNAQAEMAQWTGRWQNLLQDMGLRAEESMDTVLAFMEGLEKLFDGLAQANTLQIQLVTQQSIIGGFEAEANDLIAQFFPDLELKNDLDAMPNDVVQAPGGAPNNAQYVKEAVIRLQARLTQNLTDKTSQQNLEEQITGTEEELEAAKTAQQEAQQNIQGLCVEARCDKVEDLQPLEQLALTFKAQTNKLAEIEADLLEIGEGAGIDALLEQGANIDVDELAAQIIALSDQITQELEPRVNELSLATGRLEKELEIMNGGANAARLAEDAENRLTKIRRYSERYVQVKLAATLLRRQIEKYRQENQAPLLALASRYFRQLTLDGFSQLTTHFNAKDEPVLAAVRADGTSILVEGMSSGTRDQLYLALRLASLEKYVDRAEPMPFIVDDVLIEFDDQRSKAALQALQSLSAKTQVIMFTHHQAVVEHAQNLDPRDGAIAIQAL